MRSPRMWPESVGCCRCFVGCLVARVGRIVGGRGPKMLVSFSDPAVTVTDPCGGDRARAWPRWSRSALRVRCSCRLRAGSRRRFSCCPPFCAFLWAVGDVPPSPCLGCSLGGAWRVRGSTEMSRRPGVCPCAWRRKPLWARGHNRARAQLRRECDTPTMEAPRQGGNPATARSFRPRFGAGPHRAHHTRTPRTYPQGGNAGRLRAGFWGWLGV